MKKTTLFCSCALALCAGSLIAADTTPRQDIENAARKLGASPNYSWKTTIVVPENAPFKPGPTEGKTQSDGLTYISISFFGNTIQAVVKGKKGAATNQEGAWKSLEDLDKEEGPGRFLAVIVSNIRTPSTEAAQLASFAKDLKKQGDVYSGDLNEEGAKTMQLLKPRAGDEAPTVSDAKGSVKFWLAKDGALTKYEAKLKGTVHFGGNDFPNERTTTVEIKDVGTTKIEIPQAAQKKLE